MKRHGGDFLDMGITQKTSMRILILTQAFYPDVVSVAQHATDLAAALSAQGYEITVISSRRAYDSPAQKFPAFEIWRGIRIRRENSTSFGKASYWRRAFDFGSFYLSCIFRLIRLPRYDVVIALTTPPLITVLAAAFVRIKGGSLLSWIMDLNPDEAIAAGALKPDSLLAKSLSRLLRFSLSASSSVVVLDSYMKDRIVAKNIPDEKILIVPPWTHDSVVRYDEQGRERFRAMHGLTGKFVVMYSGNHSPCHPLDTLLESARKMADDREVTFLFVGGGSQFAYVRQFASRNSLTNIKWLPYQPMSSLAESLSAADLHVVIMGNQFVGTVHPCKIYNILATGSPFLYIGPGPSHVTELGALCTPESGLLAEHGKVDDVVRHIKSAAARGSKRYPAHAELAKRFSESALVPTLVSAVVRLGESAEGQTVKGCSRTASEPPTAL